MAYDAGVYTEAPLMVPTVGDVWVCQSDGPIYWMFIEKDELEFGWVLFEGGEAQLGTGDVDADTRHLQNRGKFLFNLNVTFAEAGS